MRRVGGLTAMTAAFQAACPGSKAVMQQQTNRKRLTADFPGRRILVPFISSFQIFMLSLLNREKFINVRSFQCLFQYGLRGVDNMKQYNVPVVRQDLRWLDTHGIEKAVRGKHDYVFRSSVTDEAQRQIQAFGFDGSYMRQMYTGHAETEWINLAMLSFSERYNGIVGVTLEGLVNDQVTQTIINMLPAGLVLYEVLENPCVFRVSRDDGISIPNFNDDYAATNISKCTFYDSGNGVLVPSGKIELIPKENDKAPNKQAEKIKAQVYIELQPAFVAKLGSVDVNQRPAYMDSYRKITEEAKEQMLHTKQGLVGRVLDAFTF